MIFWTLQKATNLRNIHQHQITANNPAISHLSQNDFNIKESNQAKRGEITKLTAQIDPKHAHMRQKRDEWTKQEEELLISLHNQKGNKWVEIARLLQKSDNSVKNHYHSKLRKALRKLNKCISEHLKSECKILKNSLLSKIVQTAQAYHSQPNKASSDDINLAFKLKNDILAFADFHQQLITNQQIIKIKKLLIEIAEFNRNYKKQTKPKLIQNAISCKSKGKEIINLLGDKSATKTVNDHQMVKNEIKREVEYKQRSEESFSIEQENEVNLNVNVQMNKQNYLNNILMFNQPFFSLYYPYIAPNSLKIHSGQKSSFKFYSPQNDKISQRSISTMTNIETQPNGDSISFLCKINHDNKYQL